MGRDLRHGDCLRKLSLFRLGCGEYEQLPEERWSRFDMEVHEHPILSGTVGSIRTRLRHHDRSPMASLVERHREYSCWEANRYMWLQNRDAASWEALSGRQRFKYRHLDRVWLAYSYFLFHYILKQGFLDGRAGLRFAYLKFLYFRDVRLRIAEARRNGDRNDREPGATIMSDAQPTLPSWTSQRRHEDI